MKIYLCLIITFVKIDISSTYTSHYVDNFRVVESYKSSIELIKIKLNYYYYLEIKINDVFGKYF